MEGEYAPYKGLGKIKGAATPHYDTRPEFDAVAAAEKYPLSYAIEDNAAVVFEDEVPIGALSAGGNAYRLRLSDGEMIKEEIERLI